MSHNAQPPLADDRGLRAVQGRRTRTQNIAGYGYQGEPIDGSAGGNQELSAPSAITAATEQAGGQAVCSRTVGAWRERPHLPQIKRGRHTGGMGCHPWQVTGEQDLLPYQGRRGEAIIAFLGVGLHNPPSRAVMISALAGARRTVARLQSRGEPVADWLASETRLRGIRENAAALAVMELPEHRRDTAQAYAREHPDRLGVVGDLLAVLA